MNAKDAFTLPGGGAPTSAEDLALVEELRRLRPTGSVPAVHSTHSPVTPAPGAGAAGAEEAAEASQTMLQRLTVALELIAGSGEMARVTMPKTKRSQLFKMEGHAVASLRTSSTRTSSATLRR